MVEAIYADRCAGCHGETGVGDGELSDQLQFLPAPLGDPEVARQAAPVDWFTAVTVGNLERLMPGFASLTDQERWDVVGYAFGLSVPSEQRQRGEELYGQACASCHAGEGPGTNLGTGRQLVDQSAAQLYELISQGAGEAMPGFEDSLSAEERWALASFLQARDLTAGVSHPEPVAAPADEQLLLGTVTGTVRNGTSGSAVPPDLEVSLRGFDGELESVTRSTTVDSNGDFAFEGVEVVPSRLLVTTVEYQGVAYRSDLAHLLPEDPALELPLTVYEATPDTDLLSVQRLHILFDFSLGGVARVLELWALSNPTDRVMFDPEGVLKVGLPEGAVNLQFEEAEDLPRFLITEDGFADTAPLLPGLGGSDLAFGFDLQFDRRLDFEQLLNHRVQAVIILMPPEGPRLTGEGVQDLGVQDMGGITMHNYAIGTLEAGEVLSFQLSQGFAAGLGELQVPSLAIGAGVLGIALLLVGNWWFRRGAPVAPRQMSPETAPTKGTLLREIARLDEAFGAGSLEEAEYLNQRELLKRRALELMARDDD